VRRLRRGLSPAALPAALPPARLPPAPPPLLRSACEGSATGTGCAEPECSHCGISRAAAGGWSRGVPSGRRGGVASRALLARSDAAERAGLAAAPSAPPAGPPPASPPPASPPPEKATAARVEAVGPARLGLASPPLLLLPAAGPNPTDRGAEGGGRAEAVPRDGGGAAAEGAAVSNPAERGAPPGLAVAAAT